MDDGHIAAESLEDRLRSAIPEFAASVHDHRDEYGGEILPHVLFGDLTRFVEAAAERGDWALVDRCLQFLDLAIASDDESVENLVAVSFVENLDPGNVANSAIFERLPAHLKTEFERQRDWRRG